MAERMEIHMNLAPRAKKWARQIKHHKPNLFAEAARLMERWLAEGDFTNKPGYAEFRSSSIFACHALQIAKYGRVGDALPEERALRELFREPDCKHSSFLSCVCAFPDKRSYGGIDNTSVTPEMIEIKILALCFAAAMLDAGDIVLADEGAGYGLQEGVSGGSPE